MNTRKVQNAYITLAASNLAGIPETLGDAVNPSHTAAVLRLKKAKQTLTVKPAFYVGTALEVKRTRKGKNPMTVKVAAK